MGYEYMNSAQFKTYTKLDDAGIAKINPGETMSIEALISLKESTKGRFDFNIDISGTYADVYWVNYYQTEGGNYKVNDDDGIAVTDTIQTKQVVIG